MNTIYTLNARDNILLPIIRDHFNLSNSFMRNEILRLHKNTVEILKSKDVNYSDLRTALVPSNDKNEAGFIFDSSVVKSSEYGQEIMSHLLPLLDKRSTHSVLHSELLGEDQELIYEILHESMVLARSFTFKHSLFLFCIYVNNLSNSALANLHKRLCNYPPYVGYIPATYASRGKLYLSTTLGGAFLKFKSKIILGHEDDRPNTENVNLLPYSFNCIGNNIASIQSTYYSLFLNFKIERPIFDPDENDAFFSLNTISDSIIPLHECNVLLEKTKYRYLQTEKRGKLEKAGLADLNRDQLSLMIKSKITSNYIYNLSNLDEYEVIKFNIMLEIPHKGGGYPTRVTVALEYLPEKRIVRVITLY